MWLEKYANARYSETWRCRYHEQTHDIYSTLRSLTEIYRDGSILIIELKRSKRISGQKSTLLGKLSVRVWH